MYLFQVYSLLSSPVIRAQMMAGCWVERRLIDRNVREGDAIKMPVHPFKKLNCLYIIFLPKIFYTLYYYY